MTTDPRLPPRRGSRPKTTARNPHGQLDQKPADPAIREVLASQVFALPGVTEHPSPIPPCPDSGVVARKSRRPPPLRKLSWSGPSSPTSTSPPIHSLHFARAREQVLSRRIRLDTPGLPLPSQCGAQEERELLAWADAPRPRSRATLARPARPTCLFVSLGVSVDAYHLDCGSPTAAVARAAGYFWLAAPTRQSPASPRHCADAQGAFRVLTATARLLRIRDTSVRSRWPVPLTSQSSQANQSLP